MIADAGSLDLARRTLRPSAAEAEEAWRRLVLAERAQVEALPDRPSPEDFYAPVAERFLADPHRRDDPVLEAMLRRAGPDETWLDLGAGAGRYALPLALAVREVYAVEPSAGMLATLHRAVRQYGIANLQSFQERWPGPSRAPRADVGLICHVGYDIEDIGPFLDQLETHSRRLCLAVLFDASPIALFAPLWRQVHGEERVTLPALAEFVALLFARGRRPEIELLWLPPRAFAGLEEMHAAARRPLWVSEGSEKDRALGRALRELAVTVDGGIGLDARPRCLGIVSWQPEPP